MQEHLYWHFESKSHSGFRDGVSAIWIHKTDGSNPIKIETYWIRTLKAVVPYGLNVENGV